MKTTIKMQESQQSFWFGRVSQHFTYPAFIIDELHTASNSSLRLPPSFIYPPLFAYNTPTLKLCLLQYLTRISISSACNPSLPQRTMIERVRLPRPSTHLQYTFLLFPQGSFPVLCPTLWCSQARNKVYTHLWSEKVSRRGLYLNFKNSFYDNT